MNFKSQYIFKNPQQNSIQFWCPLLINHVYRLENGRKSHRDYINVLPNSLQYISTKNSFEINVSYTLPLVNPRNNSTKGTTALILGKFCWVAPLTNRVTTKGAPLMYCQDNAERECHLQRCQIYGTAVS